MSTRLEQKLLQKSLNRKFDEAKERIVEEAINDFAKRKDAPIKVKNVCAYCTEPLVERLENTLKNLKMTKREFVTFAIIDALDKADNIMNEVGVFDDEIEAYERQQQDEAA